MTLRGLPPFLPLARAAAAFAGDVTRPPLRPRATAARLATGAQLRKAGRHRGLALFDVGQQAGLVQRGDTARVGGVRFQLGQRVAVDLLAGRAGLASQTVEGGG